MHELVLLRYPNWKLKSRSFAKSVCRRNLDIFWPKLTFSNHLYVKTVTISLHLTQANVSVNNRSYITSVFSPAMTSSQLPVPWFLVKLGNLRPCLWKN